MKRYSLFCVYFEKVLVIFRLLYILESGLTNNINNLFSYGDNDDYYLLKDFEEMDYGIIMNIGGENILQGIRHLTYNIKTGKKFLFNVFGEMFYNGDVYYQIKPFAVWR